VLAVSLARLCIRLSRNEQDRKKTFQRSHALKLVRYEDRVKKLPGGN
jgi:hypothetical protein